MSETHLEEREGIVSSHNPIILGLIVTLIVGLASGAFVLSFRALNDLAVASGIDNGIAWIWPLIIDGFIITATIAAFALRGRGAKTTWYPWAALILFAIVSIFGNSLHATEQQSTLKVAIWIATLVSAAPAVALLLASHFLVIMISAPRYIKVANSELESKSSDFHLEAFEEPKIGRKVTKKVEQRNPKNLDSKQTPAIEQRQNSELKPETSIQDAVSFLDSFPPNKATELSKDSEGASESNSSDEDTDSSTKPKSLSDSELEDWARERIQDGMTVTNADIQDRLGCSLRTAQRRMASLKELIPEIDS